MPIEIYRWEALDAGTRQRLLMRARADLQQVLPDVKAILEDVRRRGDAAVVDYLRRFDGIDWPPERWRVSPEAMAAAWKELAPEVREALHREAEAVRRFHEAQRERPIWLMEMAPGVIAGQIVRPLDSAGLYIPGGRAVYPTIVHALGIPASVAGVRRIVACTPPAGRHPAVLAAAHAAGVTDFFLVGGVAAIAAMAYGTETIPRVDKIVGPGNLYVLAAKALVMGEVAIDMLAGPTEVIVLADETARPDWVAAELLAQAEHDPHTSCLLVTPVEALAHAVRREIERQGSRLPRWAIARQALETYGGLIVTADMETAIEVCNAYAPEHLAIYTRDPWAILPAIRHAGSVFLGPWSAVAAGDYATGTNNTLPTGGWARAASSISVDTFVKKIEVEALTEEGLRHLAPVITTLAEVEGLHAHAASIRIRLPDLPASSATV
ncbi:histidinol dehydrogenase [Thermoflexus sp.]|uniref:histidinol dehydrogenase n=1 Tax=Thermoflexus sp. TaxID=1969742 RepID=UPI0018199098|nr:histidinol dehydrogenase [Thermoflexus sp.]